MMSIFYALLFWYLGIFNQECKADDGIDLNLFNQSDYKLKFERVELMRHNKDMVDASVITFKYNRTTAVANVTFTLKINMGTDVHTIVQVYKFMSNEYRYFPIRFAANSCKAIAANVAGMNDFMKCGNFTYCPHLKGVKYHVCNWFPDPAHFPPLVPDGQYKVELQVKHASVEVAVANMYITVSRPIPYV